VAIFFGQGLVEVAAMTALLPFSDGRRVSVRPARNRVACAPDLRRWPEQPGDGCNNRNPRVTCRGVSDSGACPLPRTQPGACKRRQHQGISSMGAQWKAKGKELAAMPRANCSKTGQGHHDRGAQRRRPASNARLRLVGRAGRKVSMPRTPWRRHQERRRLTETWFITNT